MKSKAEDSYNRNEMQNLFLQMVENSPLSTIFSSGDFWTKTEHCSKTVLVDQKQIHFGESCKLWYKKGQNVQL